MNHEPTVIQIVDRIMALEPGESCDVELDPHITRVGNMEWLLPLCVRQLGTEIAIREHPEGSHVILTITATAAHRHKHSYPPAPARSIEDPLEQQNAIADEELVAVV